MELIDRYISAVAQQLPASRRDDITRELKANILDRLESLAEEQGRASSASDESAVLYELGHPQQVATSFLPTQTLVNTTWFPIFKQCLVYGLILVFVIQLISFSIALISTGTIHIAGFLAGFVHRALVMFALVTGVFYLLSNLPATAKISPYCNWKPELLPPVQQPWQRIKLLDSTSEFANNLFFLLLLQSSFWMPAETIAKIPVSVGPALQPWILPFTIWALIALAFNVWNLRYGYWTQTKLWFFIALNLVGCAFALVTFFSSAELVLINNSVPPFIAAHLNSIIRWVVAFAICIFACWVARSVYRLYLLKKINL